MRAVLLQGLWLTWASNSGIITTEIRFLCLLASNWGLGRLSLPRFIGGMGDERKNLPDFGAVVIAVCVVASSNCIC